MIQAVIFDFDGVITDSEILHFRAFNEVLQPFGIVMDKEEYYSECLGLSDADLLDKFAEQGRLTSDKSVLRDIISKKNKIFEKLAHTNAVILDGVESFLDKLLVADIPLAICSGALLSEIELILDKACLRPYFKTIVSADQVKKGKPNPEGFLLALQRLRKITGNDIKNNRCVVIEDSHWGLEAAADAKMHPVAVTNSYPAEKLKPADMVVERVDELTVEKLNQLCK